jgi:hypothetical protein
MKFARAHPQAVRLIITIALLAITSAGTVEDDFDTGFDPMMSSLASPPIRWIKVLMPILLSGAAKKLLPAQTARSGNSYSAGRPSSYAIVGAFRSAGGILELARY